MIHVIVLGGSGRMGQSLHHLIQDSGHFELAASLSSQDSPSQSAALFKRLSQYQTVLIDFSLPGVIQPWLPLCQSHAVAVLSGVTGLSDEHTQSLQRASKVIPVMWSSNMSVGIQLLQSALKLMSKWATSDTTIDILDIHHKGKRDAPSGTALTLAETWLQSGQSNDPLPDQLTLDECDGELRCEHGSMSIRARRQGDVIGEHRLSIDYGLEEINMTHRAKHRDVFASGALKAAQWLINQNPGYYLFADLFRVE